MGEAVIADLCSGYGGLSEGLRQALGGGRVVLHADNDPGATAILAARYPGVPNLGDIKRADWREVSNRFGAIDWLCAGYPCQPWSNAGLRKGASDERHLWPWIVPAIDALRPAHVLLENVAGHVRQGLPEVLADLGRLGYGGAWAIVKASDVGAPHERKRVFIIGVRGRAGGFRRIASPTGIAGERGRHALARDARGRSVNGYSMPDLVRRLPLPRLAVGVPLFKTPTANLGSNGGSQHPAKRKAGGHGPTLADEVEHLLPANDGFIQDWAEYAPAVERWEALTGRRAPLATMPGTRAARVLNPALSEWMMGIETGHVTGLGLTRGAAMKAIGNGVVPPQAAYAVNLIMQEMDGEAPMGDKTNPAILAEIARKTDELNERIMTAVMGEVASADSIGEVDRRMPAAFAAGLAVIIETWRTEAQERVDARRQGAKGAQTKTEYAAGLLAGVAVGLREAPLGSREAVAERGPAAEVALPKTETKQPVTYCGNPHPFMDESCELPSGHQGSHSKTGMGVWPKAPRLRGCAPELCGGSSYDACIPAIRTADRVHADEIATPGVDEQCRETAPTYGEACLRIAGHEGQHTDLTMLWDRSELAHCAPPTLPAEIFAGQCIGIHEGERCMLPSTHTSRHTGTQGTHWEGGGVALNPVATMLAEVKAYEWKGDALTAAEALADNERRFELDSLRAAAEATGAFSEAALESLTGRDAGGMDADGHPPFPGEPGYCHDCDAGGHTCKGCGAATHHDAPFACPDPTCVANEPSIVSADPAIPPPPVIVSAAEARCERTLNDGHAAHQCTKRAGHDGECSLAVSEYRVGDTVTVGGLGFVKISDNPFPIIDDGSPLARAILGVAPPEIVPPAYSPKSLGIRRLAWSELAAPPAAAETLRPAHRSVSQLETYSGCGLKYRLQRYGETTDVPSWSLVGGLAIHQVIERMEAAGWDRKNSEVWPEVFEEVVAAHETSSGISRDLWIAADGGKENGDWWLVEGEKMSQNFRLWRKKMISDGWKITAVEYEINTPADWVGVPVKGFLDLVMWHPETGTVLLPDVKSGRNRPQSRTQLDIYGRALDRLGVPGVDSGEILKIEAGYLMVRKGELIDRHDVMAEGLAEAEIAARLVTMDRAERAGVYLPNPSALCGSCGVRAGCPVGRPAAAEAPAPVAP